MKRALFVVALGLAGCRLTPTSIYTPDTVERRSSTGADAPTRISGAVVRDQMEALYGMTGDQATAALASYGHDGSVMVLVDDTHQDGVEVGVVVRLSRPDSGMGIHDAITLYTNPPG